METPMLSAGQRSAVAQLAIKTSLFQEDLEAAKICSDTGEMSRRLEACNWDVPTAESALRATLKWRRENELQALRVGTSSLLSAARAASDSGKLYVRGYDRFKRPIIYLKMGFEKTAEVEGMFKLAVYCMERAIACIERRELEGRAQLEGAPSSAGQLVLLVNFAGYSRWHGAVARHVLRKIICTLQEHYPMRLGAIFLTRAPCCFWTFFSPCLDRQARSKVRFLRGHGVRLEKELSEHFDLARLESSMGGKNKLPFSSKVFFGPSCTGHEFGLEFDEQAASELTSRGFEDLREALLRDPRMLALGDDAERELVLSLGCTLQVRGEDEDSQDLFDNAGALIRYLRARKWDQAKAEDLIRNTAHWRKEFGFEALRKGALKDIIAVENATGKLYCRGYDRRGRPILYMKPRLENSSDHEGMCQHLVYNMERAVACIERREKEIFAAAAAKGAKPAEGLTGKLALLVDFNGYSLANSIRIGTAMEVLSILQDHYPERLGQAFLLDPPWIFSTLWNAVSPFVDPVTYEKIQFVTEDGEARQERLSRTFDLAVLEEGIGGYEIRPFSSEIYLNTEVDGSAFGLEYNEQLALHSKANLCGAADGSNAVADTWIATDTATSSSNGPAPDSFWTVCSDPRVLALPKDKRAIVRALARRLPIEANGAGLFDDAGALLRYLEAGKWKREKAEALLRFSAHWRRDFCIAALRAGEFQVEIEVECSRGAMYVRGYDLLGRPIVYIRPALQNGTWSGAPFMRYLVYCLERAAACVDAREGHDAAGQEAAGSPSDGGGIAEGSQLKPSGKIMLLVDFADFAFKRRPPMRILRQMIRILQDHYPERLGSAILLKPPPGVMVAWRLLSPFLDAKTCAKFQVVQDDAQQKELLSSMCDLRTLERGVGGENDTSFQKDIFLNQKVGGAVYGVEFDAQLAARHPAIDAGPQPAAATEGRRGWFF